MIFDNEQIIKEQFDAAIYIYFRNKSVVPIIPILTLLYPANEVLSKICDEEFHIKSGLDYFIEKIKIDNGGYGYKEEIKKITNYKNYLKHHKKELNPGLVYTEELVECTFLDTLVLYIKKFGFLGFHVNVLFLWIAIKKSDNPFFKTYIDEVFLGELKKGIEDIVNTTNIDITNISRNDFYVEMVKNYDIIEDIYSK